MQKMTPVNHPSIQYMCICTTPRFASPFSSFSIARAKLSLSLFPVSIAEHLPCLLQARRCPPPLPVSSGEAPPPLHSSFFPSPSLFTPFQALPCAVAFHGTAARSPSLCRASAPPLCR